MPHVRGAIRLLPRVDAIEEIVHVLLVAFVTHVLEEDFVLTPLLFELVAKRRFRNDARGARIPALRSLPLISEMHGGVRSAQQH
jgi:hypothetical protein